MAGKVILGRHTQIRIVYDNVPYTFRINKFSDDPKTELRGRDHLGQSKVATDRIRKEYGGTLEIAEADGRLDAILADMDARDEANLPPAELLFTVTKVYRDGVTPPSTTTFTGVVMEAGTDSGGRTNDVTRSVTWMAETRAFGT